MEAALVPTDHEGIVGRLRTPWISQPKDNPMCVSFWYVHNGITNKDSLSVFANISGHLGHSLWKEKGKIYSLVTSSLTFDSLYLWDVSIFIWVGVGIFHICIPVINFICVVYVWFLSCLLLLSPSELHWYLVVSVCAHSWRGAAVCAGDMGGLAEWEERSLLHGCRWCQDHHATLSHSGLVHLFLLLVYYS